MNLQNLVDYCQWQGIDIFENCTVPAPLDIEMVKNEIMKKCGLLRPVYGEPEVFKALTKMWFDSNQWNFDHLVNIINAEYSPIENVYESDHYTTKHTGTDKREFGGKDIDSLSGSDTFQHGETHSLSGTDTVTDKSATEHQVSAFNTAGYQASSKDSNSGDIDTKYGKKDTASGTDTTGYGKRDTLQYGKTDDFTHGHIETYDRLRHGNIGVTTNDQLILEELSMLEKFNPYDWIAAKFERENFLQIY